MNSLSIQKNSGDVLDAKAKAYAQSRNITYREALYIIVKQNAELGRSYMIGEQIKKYGESPARTVMNELLADPEKTRRLASALLDKLAREKLINKGDGSDPDPLAAYRRALTECRREYPTLARAAEDGFIGSDDFKLLGMLVPSVAKEVEEGRYSQTRCACGEPKIYCRARKLAQRRNIDEDDVKKFSRCILDAQDKTELDKILCFY